MNYHDEWRKGHRYETVQLEWNNENMIFAWNLVILFYWYLYIDKIGTLHKTRQIFDLMAPEPTRQFSKVKLL